MTTPQDVVAQAQAMVTGSRLERARAGMTALNLFNQLSASDKRDLAVLVAQRAAPNLVPRIRAETGMDLTTEQSRAVLDMVQRLDGDDLAEIQRSLSTPEARRATLEQVGTAAATATGVDDVVADTPPLDRDAVARATADAPADEPHQSSEHQQARQRMLEGRVDELTAELAGARTAVSKAEGRARTAEGLVQDAQARAEAAERRTEDQGEVLERARLETRQAADRVREAEENVRRMEARKVSAAGAVPRAGSTPTRSSARIAGIGDVAQLATRMHDTSASGALRMFVGSLPSMAAMGADDRYQLVTSIPDGWARRKAIQRLVEAGAVDPSEAGGLLTTLASNGNQVFAAGSMLEAGLLDGDALVESMAPEALARLRRRTGLA